MSYVTVVETLSELKVSLIMRNLKFILHFSKAVTIILGSIHSSLFACSTIYHDELNDHTIRLHVSYYDDCSTNSS